MAEILRDTSDTSVIAAIDANRFEFYKTVYAGWPRAELHDSTTMLSYTSPVPFPVFNSIHHARLPLDGLDSAIEKAMSPFWSKKLPMFWWIGPATRPPGLGALLEAHGLKHAQDAPGMAISLSQVADAPPGPATLSIQRVIDLKSLRRWADVAVRSFDLPEFVVEPAIDIFRSAGFEAASPVRSYLGIVDGEPVAASTMFLGAGVAGIYNVGTVPEARRRGIGAAMTRAPLLEAREEGYTIAILHASAQGTPVYEALGFREYCTLSCYMWMPSDS